jgi:mono/diheme cytochrome c family protein
MFLTGCNVHLPGQPTEAERWRAPGQITDFNQLYTENCAGCHGTGGKLGAARSLNDPLYLAFVTDDAMVQAISKGRPGTNMPAFSEPAGGHLTDQQIQILVAGMRAKWSRPDDFKNVEIPSLSRRTDSGHERLHRLQSTLLLQRTLSKLEMLREAPQLTKPIARVVTAQTATAVRPVRSLMRTF